MDNNNYQSNEVVILSYEKLSRKISTFSTETGDLTLTNLYLVWSVKNMFGNVKSTQQYPLNTIKIYNGKVQVKAEKSATEFPKLTIFFMNGQVVFEIINKSEDELKTLANSINQVLTGSDSNLYDVKNYSNKNVAKAAEVLKGTVNVFKDVLGVKDIQQNVIANEKVAKKCTSCSALISGIKDQITVCEYCDTVQQL